MKPAADPDDTWRHDRTPEPLRAADPTALTLPILTILAHPDPGRVGDVAPLTALLAGEPVALSRIGPTFRAPNMSAQPLSDRFLSRKALVLTAQDGAVILRLDDPALKVWVDGAALAGTLRLSSEELEHGVVLDLGRRVALLLERGVAVSASTRRQDDAMPMLGVSAGIERVRQQVARVAGSAVPVLVRGETGSGKELVARAIHRAGPRRDRPLVVVNMAAVPPSLAASELFGHKKGAFSGASEPRDGYFAQADGGTIFLDEIADAAPDVQALLLRVLETGELQAVGATQCRKVDVRVIAATDAALEHAVAVGRFRSPLYHRLAGFEVHVPRLCARKQDLGVLLHHFIAAEAAALGEANPLFRAETEAPWLPTTLWPALIDHPWPGNIRELKNIARQLVLDGAGQPHADIRETCQRLRASVADPEPATSKTAIPKARDPLDEERILAALEDHDWRLTRAAQALGIGRNTLNAFIDQSPKLARPRDLDKAAIETALAAHGGDLAAAARSLKVSERGLKLRLKALGL